MLRSLVDHRVTGRAAYAALRSFALVALGAITLASTAGVPASAQMRVEKIFGSWTVLCIERASQPKQCAMRQSRVRPDNRQAALVWAIRSEENDGLVQSITVPVGVSIGEGIRIFLGDAEPMILAYDVCGPRVCIASAPLDTRFIVAIQQGGRASANYVRGSKQLVQVQLDLSGFAEAYDYLVEQLS